MKKEFSTWFKNKVNLSSPSSMSFDYTKELRALAHGPLNAYSYTACIVNGVKFVVHDRDVEKATQNSGVVSIGDGTTFYGQLEDIIELIYIDGYSVVLFCYKWFDTSGARLKKKNNITTIDISRKWFVGNAWYDDQQYILATQAKQVFYLQDPSSRTTNNWRVVEDVHHRKLWDHPSMSVVNEIDILHDTQSSDFNLVVDSSYEVGEPSARLVNEETNVLRDTQSIQCNLVVDLGCLPMRTPLVKGGCPSPIVSIVDDEMVVDDDEDNMYTLDKDEEMNENKDEDEEEEMNDDKDADDDRLNTLHNSDDSY
ncbi:hypothetical protein Hdeb2414_s0013g00402541 [Helianthus debilis subsp. tardiflorus]